MIDIIKLLLFPLIHSLKLSREGYTKFKAHYLDEIFKCLKDFTLLINAGHTFAGNNNFVCVEQESQVYDQIHVKLLYISCSNIEFN